MQQKENLEVLTLPDESRLTRMEQRERDARAAEEAAKKEAKRLRNNEASRKYRENMSRYVHAYFMGTVNV